MNINLNMKCYSSEFDEFLKEDVGEDFHFLVVLGNDFSHGCHISSDHPLKTVLSQEMSDISGQFNTVELQTLWVNTDLGLVILDVGYEETARAKVDGHILK